MFIVIEYTRNDHGELEVKDLHGPFDKLQQAEDWAKAHADILSGAYDIFTVSSVS